MKKLITLLFAITLSFGGFTQQTDTIAMTGCNFNTPGWGESLGIVSFYTNNKWTIEGNGIFQIWSDAVTATACQKTSFDGGYHRGTIQNFNADCRSNPNFPGDLFSWCAVVRFTNILCPYPWRVPTAQDFRDLDIALGGTGGVRTDLDFINANYINRWGGVFGATCYACGSGVQEQRALYWSQTNANFVMGRGILLTFRTTGQIFPEGFCNKRNGRSLRCVR